jgi:pyruvate/2-oxoglutarate dehydrogenase complex dihydrolipoamide acyltransferase (E2) component
VGSRIGVLADADDDLSTLEIPPEDSPSKSDKPASTPKEEAKSSSPAPSKPESKPSSDPAKPSSFKSTHQNKKYPLYPSVEVLLHTHNIKADSINATGPNGRLLKGDVLAFLNEIPASAPQILEDRIAKLSHLDLSNIKPAAPKPSPKEIAAKLEPEVEKVVEVPVELSVPVSLASVLQVQKRMSATLGITLPLSTFIARAIALANEDLPSSTKKAPTADELFDHIVGVSKIGKSSPTTKDGSFKPHIIALPDPSAGLGFARKAGKKNDPFDAILGLSGAQKSVLKKNAKAMESLGPENVFSLSVVKGTDEEKRAKVFLERVKSLVEVEPGRLVL